MKITKPTIEMLQSLSSINNGMIIHAGSRLRTQDTMNKVIAYADIVDEFPQDFAIYDLSEFLGALNLVSDAELEFGESAVVIKNDLKYSLSYVYGNEEYINEAPEIMKYPTGHEDNVDFELSTANLEMITKAANTLGLEFISVNTEENSTDIVLSVTDPSNPDANSFKLVVGETTAGSEYNFLFKAERLKLVKQNYKVSIHPKGISQFLGLNMEYYIVLEGSSTFTRA